eukprot:9615098-Ditylum_brightwellii.AAC.2
MSTFSTEEVHSNFPVKTLPHTNGKPTYESIHELMMAMYANEATITTSRAHKHMGLVMDLTFYATISTTAYVVPTAPVRMVLDPRTQLVDRDTADQLYKKKRPHLIITIQWKLPSRNNHKKWLKTFI